MKKPGWAGLFYKNPGFFPTLVYCQLIVYFVCFTLHLFMPKVTAFGHFTLPNNPFTLVLISGFTGYHRTTITTYLGLFELCLPELVIF